MSDTLSGLLTIAVLAFSAVSIVVLSCSSRFRGCSPSLAVGR